MKKVINDMIAINNDALSMHFKGYKTSQKDPYFAIDALVWGIVFREKSERYGPEVYLFSEYLIKNYQHLRKYSEKDIINCLVEFDVFLVEPRYE